MLTDEQRERLKRLGKDPTADELNGRGYALIYISLEGCAAIRAALAAEWPWNATPGR